MQNNQRKPYQKSETKPNFNSKKKDLKRIYESPKFFLRENVESLEDVYFEQFEEIIKTYVDWRRGKGKRPEWIFNMFTDIAFASVFEKVLEANVEFVVENGDHICEIVASAVGELERRRINHHKDVIDIYSKQYQDVNEKRVQKIFDLELPGMTWDDALRLAIISHGSPKFTTVNVLKTMYRICKGYDNDQIYALLKKLYGKENLSKVAVFILLERKLDNGKGNWIDKDLYNLLTQLALITIEEQDKEGIKQSLQLYVNERRRTEFESPSRRRITFVDLDKNEFPRILKQVKKLSKHNRMCEIYLDQDLKPSRHRSY